MGAQLQSRKQYPSDISKEQFEHIRLELENFKKQTKPRTVDLYDVFCALLYVLKSGCQWRMLPSDFPKWRTVHEYYRQWSKKIGDDQPSLLEGVLKKISWRGPYQTWAERANQFLYC
jgi:transposase